jgi:HEAT repeat protein
MTKLFRMLTAAAAAVFSHAATLYESEELTARAWLTLQQGLTSKRAANRADAAYALRLLVHNPRAQEMVERALTDPDPKVRAAAARALGPMGTESSVPKLNELLSDREPFVVLAAAHSLFLLGQREEVYDIDYQVLAGERKSADEFLSKNLGLNKAACPPARFIFSRQTCQSP